MASRQERLYEKVNGPLADRFQSRAPRLFLAWNLDDNPENNNG